jgi:nucleoside-diphosphate-sugar epimerase
MHRVLLIGKSGLIGSELNKCFEKTSNVVLVAYQPDERISSTADISRIINNLEALGRFDVIVNCLGQSKVWYSWRYPTEDILLNTVFQLELLNSKLLRDSGLIVYFGSDASYEWSEGIPQPNITSPYSGSKLLGSELTRCYAERNNNNFAIVIPSFVVGQNFTRNVLYDSLSAYSNGEKFPELHPQSKWNFVHVRALAEHIVLRVLHNDLSGTNVLVSDNCIHYSDILECLGENSKNYETFNVINRCLDGRNIEYFDLQKFIDEWKIKHS